MSGVRDTSIEAYRDITESGDSLRLETRIERCLSNGADLTRNEIAEAAHIRIQSVCGTVFSMRQAGTLVELPRRACKVTGRQAYPLKLSRFA
jgi:hypothetical protein